MMPSRYGVLCFLLFFVVLLLAYENYQTWSQPIQWAVQKEGTKRTEVKGDPSSLFEAVQKLFPSDSVLRISQNNIFHPDRKEFPVLGSVTGEQAKPVIRPQIVLYGVMIADDYQTASIANPGRPMHKGEREVKTLKLGDRVGDYKITKILSDRITVEAPGDSFDVLLYDPKAPKKRIEIKTPSRPAEVTESQVPKPATPTPVPGADIWRGRRAPRPAVPPESGRN
jgi:hypothetical protein